MDTYINISLIDDRYLGGWVDGWMDGWVDGVGGWMDGWMDGCTRLTNKDHSLEHISILVDICSCHSPHS